jgi:hypothetical protein
LQGLEHLIEKNCEMEKTDLKKRLYADLSATYLQFHHIYCVLKKHNLESKKEQTSNNMSISNVTKNIQQQLCGRVNTYDFPNPLVKYK